MFLFLPKNQYFSFGMVWKDDNIVIKVALVLSTVNTWLKNGAVTLTPLHFQSQEMRPSQRNESYFMSAKQQNSSNLHQNSWP